MLKHKANEIITDPLEALELLKEGNYRFKTGNLAKKELHDRAAALSLEQHPFVTLLCCSDSRVSGELIFDQELGDIFEIMNAGNVVDQTVLGSIEYSIRVIKVPLIIVMGHTGCGAIKVASKLISQPENIQSIVDIIGPAIIEGYTQDQISIQNVKNMVEIIKLDEIIATHKTMVIGAFYDIKTGRVIWF